MAYCEKCGESYLTRECLNCRDNEYKKTLNSNNKVDGSKYNPSSSKNNKIIIPSILAIILVLAIVIFNMSSNPLVGEWKMTQKSFMGMGKLKFTSDKMIMMGIVSRVDYEIDGDEVIVTDETGTGMIYKIIDNDTIYSELAGMKMRYKRVN